MHAGRAKALWGAGSAGIAALACLWLALTPLAAHASSNAPHEPRTNEAASLSASPAIASAPAIEVGELDESAASVVQTWRPVERTSRESEAEMPARMLDAPPAWTPSEPWRAPGHLRVGGEDAGDEGG